MPPLTPPFDRSTLRACALLCLSLWSSVSLTGCLLPLPPDSRSPAQVLLERSIQFHDPTHAWGRASIPMHWTGTKPDGSVSFEVDLAFAASGAFSMHGERKGHRIEYSVQDGVVEARVDGDLDVPEALQAEMVLDRDEGLFWRNYLGFLAGMPMCLNEPEVQLDAEVSNAELAGRDVLSIRATFAPEVGTDVWTFYFEPLSAALVGCRFDRADASRDGETIVFEETSIVAGIRLPRKRSWYMNADWRFLGADQATAIGR